MPQGLYHIIWDGEKGIIPPEHTDCALWMGAIHGQGASTIWVWEHSYIYPLSGSILTRPENIVAVGQCGLHLMRLAPEVAKLRRAGRS